MCFVLGEFYPVTTEKLNGNITMSALWDIFAFLEMIGTTYFWAHFMVSPIFGFSRYIPIITTFCFIILSKFFVHFVSFMLKSFFANKFYNLETAK